MTNEYSHGFQSAAFATWAPSIALSVISSINPSTPEHMNPVRDIDIGMFHNFFDHAGNLVNGADTAGAILFLGLLVEPHIRDSRKNAFILGTAVAASATSVGVSVAYEAGVPITPLYHKHANLPFDKADALYGGIAGSIMAAVFCFSALRQRAKNRRSGRY